MVKIRPFWKICTTIFNTTYKVEQLSRKSDENADSLERIIAVMSVTNKVNSALEHARISIGHLKAIMAAEKMNLQSRYVLGISQLSNIIDNIYLKRKVNTPIFSGKDCRHYYKQPIAHSWVNADELIITTLLQIPIAPIHQKYELIVLNQINKIHSDLPLAVANYESNVYRFLSMSDYASCYAAESSKICQKREIRISPKLGCTLTRKNCKVWPTEVIHDLTNSQILIYLEKDKNATLACDGEKDAAVGLPRKAMLTLNVHCSLIADSFIISTLSYRHLKEVYDYLKYENIQFNLEHKALC